MRMGPHTHTYTCGPANIYMHTQPSESQYVCKPYVYIAYVCKPYVYIAKREPSCTCGISRTRFASRSSRPTNKGGTSSGRRLAGAATPLLCAAPRTPAFSSGIATPVFVTPSPSDALRFLYMSVCICMYVYMYVCIYIYVYIYHICVCHICI